MGQIETTAEERRAISTLKRLAKRWPSTLWLFSGSGTLCVMRAGPNGEHVKTHDGGNDPAFVLETIEIPNDGGDW